MFDCNVFHFNAAQQLGVALGILLSARTHHLLQIHWTELLDFIIDVKQNYYCPVNPYHSFNHALDVTLVLHHILAPLKAERFFTPLDRALILIAALCHDCKHPGLNNLFQINAKTDLAMLFSGESVLENYSISCCLALMDTKYQLLRNLDLAEATYARNLIKEVVLTTDMSKHFALRTAFVKMVEDLMGSGSASTAAGQAVPVGTDDVTKITLPLSPANRLTLLKALLHMADISNPCRPFQISKLWSDLVIQEFFMQGDTEKGLGLEVSPNMDRETGDQFQIALGFGDFIVGPFLECLVVLLDADISMTDTDESQKGFGDYYLSGLRKNREKWIEMRDARDQQREQEEAQEKVSSLPSQQGSRSPLNNGHSSSWTAVYNNPQQMHRQQNQSNPMVPTSPTASPAHSMMSLRRFSVAAGVITIPDDNLSAPGTGAVTPLNLHKVASSRKISYEFSPQVSGTNSIGSRASSFFSEADNELTFGVSNNVRPRASYGHTAAYHRSQSHGSQSSLVSDIRPAHHSMQGVHGDHHVYNPTRSRRASVEEDQSLRKYLARRRSSNTIVPPGLASYPVGASAVAGASSHSTSPNGTEHGGRDTSVSPQRRNSGIPNSTSFPEKLKNLANQPLESVDKLKTAPAYESSFNFDPAPDSPSMSSRSTDENPSSQSLDKTSPKVAASSLASATIHEPINTSPGHLRPTTARQFQRTTQPNGYLNMVSSALATITIEDMLIRSVLESLTISRDSPNRESVRSNFGGDPSIQESRYQTVHRSSLIKQYLEGKEKWRRKRWRSNDTRAQPRSQGETILVMHAGLLHVGSNQMFSGVSPVNIGQAVAQSESRMMQTRSAPSLAPLFDKMPRGRAPRLAQYQDVGLGDKASPTYQSQHTLQTKQHQTPAKKPEMSLMTPSRRLQAIVGGHRRAMSDELVKRLNQ